MPPEQENRTFEIGLVMAGAVSAGAYTAGVIDFLLQALEEWQKAKDAGEGSAPIHDVKIKVISGASAGGMTGAIFTAMMNEEFSHITSLPGKEPTRDEINRNKLYKSWVDDIDIRDLLENSDLKERNSSVKSLLDSSVLDEIAESAVSFSPTQEWKPYISKPFHLYLTLTNLQGVPYDIQFQGNTGRGHSISQHTDFLHFVLSQNNPELKEAEWLDPGNSNTKNWHLLKRTALATGAFPGGLAPRQLQRNFDHYEFRSWPVPQRPKESDGAAECVRMVNIKPAWPADHTDRFNFLSVDGGVMDNEPMELARRTLAGKQGFNPRKPESAERAVIMIDPFPSEKKTEMKSQEELENYDIVSIFTELFGSLMSQARFKPDELMLANSDSIYSRYLVAPTRRNPDGTKANYPIASGFLNGFGGFFSKKFRMHDFQLGRRNCQQFLRNYLSIPVDKARQNPVFADYTEADFERFSFQKDGTDIIPLIPLMGSAKEEVFPLGWNTLKLGSRELEELKSLISNRTKVVINRLIEQYVDDGFTRWLAKRIAGLKRGKIVDAIMEKINTDLEEFDLKS
ncbi:patatin-like phospholipase family protein [Aliifodinibius salicampi]|uniref:Patatin-like phospholipase family protein n=1 Tax=Fodinibius salicampi TaxID=1920655 RepID=A0ABT3PZF2_9BACT|nr:patatin-like phospholipase family protein [Fodinibius salicampi]MCW9713211.1 patatin-like phospholipase family protein [Fodinibius salicampi]